MEVEAARSYLPPPTPAVPQAFSILLCSGSSILEHVTLLPPFIRLVIEDSLPLTQTSLFFFSFIKCQILQALRVI